MTDLTRYRGDSYADVVTIKDAGGAAIDITGFTFLMTVDTEAQPPDNATKLFDVVGTITDAVNGEVEFAPTTVNTDQTPAAYFYDVQMTDAARRIRTILKGKYKITQDITK